MEQSLFTFQFGYYDYPAVTSKLLSEKGTILIDINVKNWQKSSVTPVVNLQGPPIKPIFNAITSNKWLLQLSDNQNKRLK